MYTEIITTVTQRVEITDGGFGSTSLDVNIDPGDLGIVLGDEIYGVVAAGLRRALKEVEDTDGND